MLGLDARTARIAWTVLLITGACAALYVIRRTLLIFICALLLAYLLAPLVNLLDRLTHNRLARPLSLAIIYALLGLGLTLAVGSIGTRVASEAGNLVQRAPEFLNNPPVEVPRMLEPYWATITNWLRSQLEAQAKELGPALQHAGQQAVAALTNLVFVILVPILSFFFLRDPGGMRDAVLRQFPDGPDRRTAAEILGDINALLIVYVRTLVLFSLITFFAYLIFLSAAGSQYAVLLALTAAVLEFIPAVGPLTAAAAIILVNAFSGLGLLLGVLVFLAIYRLTMDYVILPRLMGSEVKLSPLVILFALLAGEQLWGIAGMFLSIPIAAIVRLIYLRYRSSEAAAKG
jgi:predicted PurR-regulated permease PerM